MATTPAFSPHITGEKCGGRLKSKLTQIILKTTSYYLIRNCALRQKVVVNLGEEGSARLTIHLLVSMSSLGGPMGSAVSTFVPLSVIIKKPLDLQSLLQNSPQFLALNQWF